ncbi:hypothetical protein GCM10025857_33940 [Alicyclobacillus contaminans]|uniref:hypothetical protein n=1 Tax=Alicyclobacillus contaminans TaxID=392016 RepID=UPI00041ED767|nr:hypothetical protein [Alicyclobacillus contaminans]GMA52037.1 hypothetical protein GCM10025857_33940 [Alicyclobacillus contaminans]
MTGRVLSEEEIAAIETALVPSVDRLRMGIDSSGVVNSKTAIPNLIATIRDRDKTIAEQAAELKELRKKVHNMNGAGAHLATADLEQQNTIMLEALRDISEGAGPPDVIASRALAKVKGASG